MRLRILGVCGTFMAGLAQLARELGHDVSGNDAQVYPPMSDFLRSTGIRLHEGWDPASLDDDPELVIIGNALSRGNPLVEAVLDRGLPYTSGAQWVGEQVLRGRPVIAVAGTHGKTTTTSLIAWLLEGAGLEPGYLVGGIPQDFPAPARLGRGPFVIEADEYDTAFFDKRSKFVHYRPTVALLNNLEFDHADIFPDLEAIQRQFHHLVRIIPGKGLIIAPNFEPALDEVLQMGCWTPVEHTSRENSGVPATWSYHLIKKDGSAFDVVHDGQIAGRVEWTLSGLHNVHNALAAIAAAHHAGIFPERAAEALTKFKSVKRRMEVKAVVKGVTLYDDFAHHPTAIATTLEGLRARVGSARIIAVLEPRSNTMRMGVHAAQLVGALSAADLSVVYQSPQVAWDVAALLEGEINVKVETEVNAIVSWLKSEVQAGDHVLFMSNGSFEGIHEKALLALNS